MATQQGLNPQEKEDKKVADLAGRIALGSLGTLLGIAGGDVYKKQRTGSRILDMLEEGRLGNQLNKTEAAKAVRQIKAKNEGWNRSSRSEGRAAGTPVDLPRTDGKVPNQAPPLQGPGTRVGSKGGGIPSGEKGGTTTLATDPSQVKTTSPKPAPQDPKKKIFGRNQPAPEPETVAPKSRIANRTDVRKAASNPEVARIIQEMVAKEVERLTKVAGNITRPVETAINPAAVDKSVNRQQIKREETAGRAGVEKAREEQKTKVAEAQQNVQQVKADVDAKTADLKPKVDAARVGVVQAQKDLEAAKQGAGVPKSPNEAAIDVQGAFKKRIEAAVPERRRLVKERNKLQAEMASSVPPGLVDVATLGDRPKGRTNAIKALQAKWDADKAAIEAKNTQLTTEFESGRAARQKQFESLEKQIGALDVLITPGGKPQPYKSDRLSYTPGMEDLFIGGGRFGRTLVPPIDVADATSEFFTPGRPAQWNPVTQDIRDGVPPQYSPSTRYPNGYDPVSGYPFAPAQNSYTGPGRNAGVTEAQGAFDLASGQYGALGSQYNQATAPLQNAQQQLFAAQNPIPPYRQAMGDGARPVNFNLTPDPADPARFISTYDPMPVKIPTQEFMPGRDPYVALGNGGMQGPSVGTGRPLGSQVPLPNAGPGSRINIQDVIDPTGMQRTLDEFNREIEALRPDDSLVQKQKNLAGLLKKAAERKSARPKSGKPSLVRRVVDMMQGGAVDPMITNSLAAQTNADIRNSAAISQFTDTNKRAPNLSDPADAARLTELGWRGTPVAGGSAIANASNIGADGLDITLPRTRVGMNSAAYQAGKDLNFRGTGDVNVNLTGGRTNLSKLARGTSIGSGLAGLGMFGYGLYQSNKAEKDAAAILAKEGPKKNEPSVASTNLKDEQKAINHMYDTIRANPNSGPDQIRSAILVQYNAKLRAGKWDTAKYKKNVSFLENELAKYYKTKK